MRKSRSLLAFRKAFPDDLDTLSGRVRLQAIPSNAAHVHAFIQAN